MRFIIRQILGNPIGLALTILVLIIAAVVWFVTQVQETKDAEALKERERGRSDSIWND